MASIVTGLTDFGLICADIIPYIFPIIDTLVWLFTGDPHGIASVAGWILNMLINFGLRKLMWVLFGSHGWAYVPSECSMPCTPKPIPWLEKCGGVIDIPSFHAQSIGYYCGYWLLVLGYSIGSDYSTIRKIVGMVVLLVFAFLLMFGRFIMKCSTILQLCLGYLIGFGIGVLWFFLIHLLVGATTGNTTYF